MRKSRILQAVPFVVLFAGLALADGPAPVEPVSALNSVATVAPVAPAEALDAVEPVAAAHPIDALADACELNYTPADPEEDELGVSAKPCKACQDRPFCKCTYNGLPRVSCNPCCYGHLGIPQTCFD